MTRRVFLGAVAAYALTVVVSALVLPDRVPLHFRADLRADSFGSRAEALLVFGGVGVALTLTFTLLTWWTRRRSLDLVNVPHPGYWKAPEHEGELRRRVIEDLHHIGAATLLMLAGVLAGTTWTAVAGTNRMPWPAGAVLVGYLAYTAGWTWWVIARRYRPPPA